MQQLLSGDLYDRMVAIEGRYRSRIEDMLDCVNAAADVLKHANAKEHTAMDALAQLYPR